MAETGPKRSKMAENGQNMARNFQAMAKIGQIWSSNGRKMDKHGQKWRKMVKQWSKNGETCQKIIENGQKWPTMVKHGRKWSKNGLRSPTRWIPERRRPRATVSVSPHVMASYGRRCGFSRSAKNGQKWPKMAEKQLPIMVEKWPNMVKNDHMMACMR